MNSSDDAMYRSAMIDVPLPPAIKRAIWAVSRFCQIENEKGG